MFDFDICAPHVAIPECFTDENSIMVVFDLGRLQFRNLSPKLTSSAAAEQKQMVDDEGKLWRVCIHFAHFLEYTDKFAMLSKQSGMQTCHLSVITKP